MKKSLKISKKILCLILTCFFLVPSINIAVSAEEPKEELMGPIDIQSITKPVTKENWSYDPKTKTLTLAGVNIDGYASEYSYTEDPSRKPSGLMFRFYPGTTIIVKEGTVNNLYGRFSGNIFDCREAEGSGTGGITIKGGGTLNLYRSEIAIRTNTELNIEDANINFTDGDVFIMQFAEYYKTPTNLNLNIARSKINIDECYGAIYTYGTNFYGSDIDDALKDYSKSPINTNTVNITDSDIKMNIKLDTRQERNHSCFLIRNGYLNIDNTNLDLNSYHEAINVWRTYAPGQKAENLVTLKNVSLPDDVELSSDTLTGTYASVKGETLVTKGTKLKLSFDNSDSGFEMSFGHKFANGIKSLKAQGNKPPEVPDDKKDDKKNNSGETIEDATKTVTTADTDKNDITGSTIAPLLLKATGGKKRVNLTWKKIKSADSYVVFGSACGTKMKKLATVKGNKYTAKKLKKGKYYKYLVVAVKGSNVVSKSKTVHVTTLGGKKGNPVKIKLKKTQVKLKKGKSLKIKAKLKTNKKVKWHTAKYRYESSNPKVATVAKNGKIKAVGSGKCYVYVYTQNGVCSQIKVSIK